MATKPNELLEGLKKRYPHLALEIDRNANAIADAYKVVQNSTPESQERDFRMVNTLAQLHSIPFAVARDFICRIRDSAMQAKSLTSPSILQMQVPKQPATPLAEATMRFDVHHCEICGADVTVNERQQHDEEHLGQAVMEALGTLGAGG